MGDITGIYVRVQRDGTWQNLDIATLTDDELEAFFWRCDLDRARTWCIGLCKWMREHLLNPDE